MAKTNHKKHWSTQAFQYLLALYPAAFRDEYGREISLVFSDRYRHAAGSGDRTLLWLEALAGVLIEAPKEHCRMIYQDIRYSLRTLSKNRLLAATIVITLALGIGANSAIFSLLNAVVFRTLPLPNPGHLFVIFQESRTPTPQRFTYPMYERLRSGMSPGTIAAVSRVARMHARIGQTQETEIAAVQLVSGEFFSLLGAQVTRGRGLAPDDNRTPGAHPVAVISHGYWRSRFGESPDVIGREISLNGVRFTIVGVGPPGFAGVWLESPVNFWIPLTMQLDVSYAQNYSADRADQGKPWMLQDRIWWLDVLVRATPSAFDRAGVTLNTPFHQSMAQEADRMAATAEQRKMFLSKRLLLQPFERGFSGLREWFTQPLYVLMGMAALVLLIACANTANLLLAKSEARRREVALRLTLGSGRARLVQQLLIESLVLVLIAAGAALIIARWAGDVLAKMATASMGGSTPFNAAVDTRVLAFTAAIAVGTALLFGLAPALRSSRVELADVLKTAARGASAGSNNRSARLLVVMQVALSLVLVAGTGMLLRSLQNQLQLNMGFEREHVLSVGINTRLARYTREQLPTIHQRLLQTVEALPGVRSAAVAMCELAGGCRAFADGFEVEGYQRRPQEQVLFLTNIVGANYFSTLGMRLLEGRPLGVGDKVGAPKVAVINQSLANRYFAGRSAIGQRFGEGSVDTEIVGIVEDARVLGVKQSPVPMVFYPIEQRVVGAGTIEIRTFGDPNQISAAVRRALAEAAPELPVERIIPLTERVSANLNPDRMVLSLTSAFGALALALAAFGLFGVLSYAVARRTSEFGIRMALGASRGVVVWSVLREALLMALIGLVLGLALVAATSRILTATLIGVNPNDGTTLAASAIVIVLASTIAGVFPAWRACRVDPVTALRNE